MNLQWNRIFYRELNEETKNIDYVEYTEEAEYKNGFLVKHTTIDYTSNRRNESLIYIPLVVTVNNTY